MTNTEFTTIILHCVCRDYHSGQSSKGYRILSATTRRIRRWGYSLNHLPTTSQLEGDVRLATKYTEIASKIADKL